jgi:translocator protein
MKKTEQKDAYSWYRSQKRPSWAPPAWLFSPVWTVLYILIAISFGTVFYKAATGALPIFIAAPFALNLVCNAAFTPIQFGLRNNKLAAVDILLCWLTLAWAMAAVYPYASWITYTNIPYILWVSFATVLQLTVTRLNWGK